MESGNRVNFWSFAGLAVVVALGVEAVDQLDHRAAVLLAAIVLLSFITSRIDELSAWFSPTAAARLTPSADIAGKG